MLLVLTEGGAPEYSAGLWVFFWPKLQSDWLIVWVTAGLTNWRLSRRGTAAADTKQKCQSSLQRPLHSIWRVIQNPGSGEERPVCWWTGCRLKKPSSHNDAIHSAEKMHIRSHVAAIIVSGQNVKRWMYHELISKLNKEKTSIHQVKKCCHHGNSTWKHVTLLDHL